MNNTNRVVNRVLVAVIGVLCLALGAALVGIVSIGAIRDPYVENARDVHGVVTGWLKPTTVAQTSIPWGWILVLAVIAVVVIVMIVFVVRQGHGHHGTLLREETSPTGTTVIDSSVAESAVQQDIDGNTDFLASRVSTYRVRGVSVLKVSVTCRRGVSPRSAVTVVQRSLTGLDALLGREIPALIQVSGGFRARVAPRTRTR